MNYILNMSKSSQYTGVSTFASRTSPNTAQSLQKSLHLSHPYKIEIKKISSPSENKKYRSAQPDATRATKLNADNGFAETVDTRPAYNSGWRNGGRIDNINSSASNKHLCLVDSEAPRKPPLRQAVNVACNRKSPILL
jgi:hypothetical protein